MIGRAELTYDDIVILPHKFEFDLQPPFLKPDVGGSTK